MVRTRAIVSPMTDEGDIKATLHRRPPAISVESCDLATGVIRLRLSPEWSRRVRAAQGPTSIAVNIGEEGMAYMHEFIAREAERACVRCKGAGQALKVATPAMYVWDKCPSCEGK